MVFFHALMYGITGIGLWLLWRTKKEFPASGADRRLFACAVIGFGAWHVLDGVLSHWILGIHRIRMNVDNPLFWDVLWLAVFGVVPLVLGCFMRRGGPSDKGRVMNSPLTLLLAVIVTGPLAALPAPQETTVMVLFRPGTTPAQAFAAMSVADGRLVWNDPSEQLWAIDLSTGGNAGDLYRHGALLVTNSILPVGCFNWTKV